MSSDPLFPASYTAADVIQPRSPWDCPFDQAVIAVLDLEMTGLDPVTDQIVEVAIQRMRASGEVLGSFATVLRADAEMDPAAQRMHNITPEQIASAPTFADVAQTLYALMDGAVIVGHGTALDQEFLRAAFARMNLHLPSIEEPLDTITLARRAVRAPSYALSTLCEHLGLAQRRWHRAEQDVLAVRDLWLRIVPEFAPRTMRDLAQVRVGQRTSVVVRSSIASALRSHADGSTPCAVYMRPPGNTPTRMECVVETFDGLHALLRSTRNPQWIRPIRADRVLRIEPLGQTP